MISFPRQGLLLIAIGVFSASSPAHASLSIRLDTSLNTDEIIATLEASGQGIYAGKDMTKDISSSNRTEEDDRKSEERRKQLEQLPNLAEQPTSSSATTQSPTDGVSLTPVLSMCAVLLPSDMDQGAVNGFDTGTPPDAPRSGLLKPPRDRIKATL